MGAALGDAAWMTGLERNSDIIVMASYAPLLVNVSPGAMKWDTDLIGYDAQRSYGSPSYYAQAMFGSYLGDVQPASQVEGAGAKFFYSVTENSAKKQIYLKLVNASSEAQAVEIKLPGAKPAAAGKLIGLSAHDPEATNTLDEPKAIAPVESTLNGVAETFRHRMPPYSIEVLVMNLR
jgi:alpha-N-arabinofuranosidase